MPPESSARFHATVKVRACPAWSQPVGLGAIRPLYLAGGTGRPDGSGGFIASCFLVTAVYSEDAEADVLKLFGVECHRDFLDQRAPLLAREAANAVCSRIMCGLEGVPFAGVEVGQRLCRWQVPAGFQRTFRNGILRLKNSVEQSCVFHI